MIRLVLLLLFVSAAANAQIVIPDNNGKPLYESQAVSQARLDAAAKKHAEYRQNLQTAIERAAEAKATADAVRNQRLRVELGR